MSPSAHLWTLGRHMIAPIWFCCIFKINFIRQHETHWFSALSPKTELKQEEIPNQQQLFIGEKERGQSGSDHSRSSVSPSQERISCIYTCAKWCTSGCKHTIVQVVKNLRTI
jgi:hypothetical protein